MNDDHNPTPWRVIFDRMIICADGNSVAAITAQCDDAQCDDAQCDDVACLALATVIVKRVNLHDELVAAIRGALALIPPLQYFDDPAVIAAKAVLAKVDA